MNPGVLADRAAPLLLAYHHLGTGRPDRALAALERADSACLELPEFWQLQAYCQLQLGNHVEAAAAASAGLARDAHDPELFHVLALARLAGDDKRGALRAIDEAVSLAPGDATLHARRAMILARSARRPFRKRRFDEARRELDEALRLDPESEAALRARAFIAVLARDDDAAGQAAELVALNPQDERAHVLAAAALARRGQLAAAGRHVAHAAALDPEDARLVWVARRQRMLGGVLYAPIVLAHRLTRGHFRLVWVVTAVVVLGLHKTPLTIALIAFAAYMWIGRFWLRARTGKAPK